jgi:hypothetical protein
LRLNGRASRARIACVACALSLGCAAAKPVTTKTPSPSPLTIWVNEGATPFAKQLQKQSRRPLVLRSLAEITKTRGAVENGAVDKDPPIAELKKQLGEAKVAYRQLHFEVALALLGQTRTSLLRSARRAEDFALLARVLFLRGLCALALADKKTAGQEIAWALRLRKEPIRPGEFSPEVDRFIKATRRAQQAATPGSLSLTSKPTRASVYIDGKHVGRTPLTLQLLPGLHHVRVGYLGRKDKGAAQLISSGRIEGVEFFLQPLDKARLASVRKLLYKKQGWLPNDPLLIADLVARAPLLQKRGDELLIFKRTPKGSLQIICRGSARKRQRCLTRSLFARADQDARKPPRPGPFYTRWWFWTATGVAVLGGVAAGIAGAYAADPSTDLVLRRR